MRRWQEILNHQVMDRSELESWVHGISLHRPSRLLILLKGETGAGKTQWVRFLMKALSFGELTSSPTFSLHNVYKKEDSIIDHFDLYRVENLDELESTGFWDLFTEPNGLVIVEWAQNLPEDLLPHNWSLWEISLEVVDAHHRAVSFRKS